MSLLETIEKVRAFLESQGRISLRVLKLEFELNDDQVEALVEQLVDVQQVAALEGKVLSWMGPSAALASGTDPEAHAAAAAARQPVTAPEAERRQLTVLFCDLVGSTDLSGRLGPEELRNVVRAYQESASEVIDRYEGHIAQYLGDGLLVYFGYPRAHEDDAERAVRTGRGVLAALARLNDTLEPRHGLRLAARVGIHTGPVVVGEMGGAAKRETLALGATPNIAARLEDVAEPGSVVISDATLRLVAGLFVTEDRGTPALKGISQPIRVHRVLHPSGVSSRLDRAPALSPFVGREQELGLLLDRFEQAQEGRGQAVLIAGEAGIGKSRLVHRLRERLRETPHTWLECRCSPYTQSSALYPAIELLEESLDLDPQRSSEEKLAHLERGVAHAGLEPAEAVPLFASLLSLPLPERYAPLEISPELQRRKTMAALAAWLLALGEKQAALLVVEDLHWVDPSTLAWLGLLVEQCPTARVLLLLTYRAGYEPPWPVQARLSHIALDRLKREEARSLVLDAISGAGLPEEWVDRIAARSDGVPLFAEELAKGLVESGRAGSLSELEIPATVQDLLMARLDRQGDAKQVAQLGAALGREFPYLLLEEVAPMKEEALRKCLGRLVEAELLYQRGLPPDANYTFKHALVQDTAYESLLESQRRELHGRIADALEAGFPERVSREPEEIARHCEAAGRTEQASAHFQRAGERAAQRSAYAEAIAHLRRALDLLDTLPDSVEHDRQELALQTSLGGTLSITQGISNSESYQAFVRARHLSERLGDAPELFRTLRGLHEFHYWRAEHARARELGEELLGLARGTGDPVQLMVAHWVTGQDSYYRGEFPQARQNLEEAIGRHDPRDHRAHEYRQSGADTGILILGLASMVLWLLGHPDQALERNRAARALARELSDPVSLATVGLFGPAVHLWRGEYQATLDEAEALVALASEHGFLLHLGSGMVSRAIALTGLGQLEEGIAGMRTFLDAMQTSVNKMGSSSLLTLLAQALGDAGQTEEGLELLEEAQAFVASSGERSFEAEVYRTRGDLLLALPTPDHERADAAFRGALEVARRQSAKSWELRAATSLASSLQRQGRQEEARALLQPVYGWFTEGFDTQDLKSAKALLEELA